MDLAMYGREESMKVKLFLYMYLVGGQGQEIYSTKTFKVPKHEQNLKQVMRLTSTVIRRKMKLLRGTSSSRIFKTQANR